MDTPSLGGSTSGLGLDLGFSGGSLSRLSGLNGLKNLSLSNSSYLRLAFSGRNNSNLAPTKGFLVEISNGLFLSFGVTKLDEAIDELDGAVIRLVASQSANDKCPRRIKLLEVFDKLFLGSAERDIADENGIFRRDILRERFTLSSRFGALLLGGGGSGRCSLLRFFRRSRIRRLAFFLCSRSELPRLGRTLFGGLFLLLSLERQVSMRPDLKSKVSDLPSQQQVQWD